MIIVNGVEIKCGEHDTLKQIAASVGWEYIKEMKVVATVRNPWDRLVSSYHFYRNGRVVERIFKGKQRNPMAILNVFAAKVLPFSLWVRLYRSKSCLDYLKSPEGNLRVDYLLRLENFEEDVESFRTNLGLPKVLLEEKNKSQRQHYCDYYNASTKKIVEYRYADDIAAFKYNF